MTRLVSKTIRSIAFSAALLTGLLSVVAQTPARAATLYYVDSKDGNDRQPGTSPEQAWKSLDAVNARVFQPGDKILFKGGSVFKGQLRPQGSGLVTTTMVTPIVIDRYGGGPRPRIEAAGAYLDAVFIHNVDGWEIQNLDISNLGTVRQPWQTGVHILSDGNVPMRHIHLENLYVHDVNGGLLKKTGGFGIFFESKGDGSCFDDLLIENCHLKRTDRNGICQKSDNETRSTRVVIRGNLLENIGGDGIKPWGCNGALVEHNIVRGARMRCTDGAAGIWPWDSENTVIQYNEVSGMKGTTNGSKDAEGFDSDALCRGTVFQYNYSHDNEGGFMLLCATPAWCCEGTVVRYNISQNDGVNTSRIFHIAGNVSDSWIYNNTIYVGTNKNVRMFQFSTYRGGNPLNTHIVNNLFYVDGTARYELGQGTNTVFESNDFYGDNEGMPMGPGNGTVKPTLIQPGGGAKGMDSAGGYQLQPGSTPLRGMVTSGNGGRDYFGNPVLAGVPPCVGASELVQ